MTSNYQFHQPLPVYLLVNISYIVWKSMLFKTTWNIYMFLHWKNYKKHCILLNATFEIPLLFTKEIFEQLELLWTVANVVIFCMINRLGLWKKLFPVVTVNASYLASFFNLLFSKCAKNSSNISSSLQSWLKM